MAYRKCLLWLGLVAAAFTAPNVARAQLYDVPGMTEPNIPVPLGNSRMESGGFYTAAEFMLLKQSRSLGSQPVAYRGVFDFTGNVGAALGLGRNPGTFYGTRPLNEALNTDDLGRGTYQPGFNLTAGYRFENGVAIYASYMNLFDAAYSAGASGIAPGYRFGNNLLGTYLSSGVVNFPTQFNGPVGIGDPGDTAIDQPTVTGVIPIPNAPITVVRPDGTTVVVPVPPDNLVVTTQTPGNTAGIWNAADTMDIRFTQRYTQVVLGSRIPVYDTDYSRTYALAGGKMSWFWENFWWRTTDLDLAGNSRAEWTAEYSNTLSQRMYGPYLGCGHEIYVGDGFGFSIDLTAALLLDVIKQRVKYERVDRAIQAKRAQLDYQLVPELDANLSLWWYPIQGVQIRAGYNVMTFFNTWRMEQPIGFDFGRIDPVYDKSYFRLLEGLNIGLAFSF